MRRAVYAGSFDPVTNGHAWVIEQGALLFDSLVVAVGDNPEKSSNFTVEERLEFLRQVCGAYENVEVAFFSHRFLIHYAREEGANFILRGIRNINDFQSEQVMRRINADLDDTIQSVFVMPPRQYGEISSSFVKGLVGPAGWEDVVRPYIPACVHAAFVEQQKNLA